MALNLQALKTAILAESDSAFVTLRTANDEQGMADWYNGVSTVIVWRSSVSRKEATADGFDWTQVDNLTTGQARIWFDGLFADGPMNPSDAGQRAGVAEAWKGTAAKVAVATFVLGKCKRAANKVEALFATGTGTTGSPSLLGYEGTVTAQNIADALRV
jgi:hypothetical protein